ncbi:hypothetical protein [Streptomyces sp. NRRL F-5123]|uniref:hypothetical protein n=1 Tax=Streptomyces sp. NRRL F-5123 TaxID=1463856 RepID=UPI0004E25163|nr:hypothetical protein [Streptomyces sp. NRRL F-5123]
MTALTTPAEPASAPVTAAAAAPRRPRVLIAPVTVTPSKPLTPSHLKGLLWADVMYRATGQVADTALRYSHTAYHPTEQTLGFWEFLDRAVGDADFGAMDEEGIGALYVRFRQEGRRAPAAALRPYADAVEHQGWTHPAALRVLELWQRHYARLGMHDPGLTAHQPPGLALHDALELLAADGLCLDQRPMGGPVYLDLTAQGLPLRQIVTAEGQPNYLACALRDLLPLAARHDEIVLLYDPDLDADYQLLQRVLQARGPAVHRVPVGRVPIDGQIRSAREGGWNGLHAGALLDALLAGHDRAAVALGARLYFLACLGAGQRESFRAELLVQQVRRARRILDAGEAPGTQAAELIGRHRRGHAYVDAYRLTSGLLGRRPIRLPPDTLREVFL